MLIATSFSLVGFRITLRGCDKREPIRITKSTLFTVLRLYQLHLASLFSTPLQMVPQKDLLSKFVCLPCYRRIINNEQTHQYLHDLCMHSSKKEYIFNL
jgi:hypothetical protein